jgi:hypothetical protein
MDRDQEQTQDRDRMWAATRLTEVAVTQLFQGASTPTDASRGQQIGKIVAELYSAIYSGKDVQRALDAVPSLTDRMANAPAKSPVLPRSNMVGRSGSLARPVAALTAPGDRKDAAGNDAGSPAGGPNLHRSIQQESAQEAPRHQAMADPADVQDRTSAPLGIPEMGQSPGAPPENAPESLQSLLSEIGAEAPQEEAPEERSLPPAEPLFSPERPQAGSLESQLASIASQGPVEPEIPPTPSSPLPNAAIPRTPTPAPVNSGVVVLEASEKPGDGRGNWFPLGIGNRAVPGHDSQSQPFLGRPALGYMGCLLGWSRVQDSCTSCLPVFRLVSTLLASKFPRPQPGGAWASHRER